MFKKRIIAVVAAFVMTVCGVALAACSDDSAKKYVVSYHANGGVFDSGVVTVYEKVEKDGYANGDKEPSKSGVDFLGWSLDKSSNDTVDLGSYPITKDTDFYAVWGTETPTAQHTVIFYYNYNGSPTERFMTTSVDDGARVAEPSPAPSRGDAYIFEGWYTLANGGTKYNFGSSVKKDLSLYAHWSEASAEPVITGIEIYHEPNKTDYVVGQTFSDDGLVVRALYSAGKAPETLEKGVDYTVSTPDMTKVGTQTVTVSYVTENGTLTAEFTISVAAKAVASLTVGGLLENNRQEVGEIFNPTGLTFKAEYNDGEIKNLTASDITFTSALLDEDGTFKDAGEAQITATYDGVSAAKIIIVTVVVPQETKYNVEFYKNNAAYADKITGAGAFNTQRIVENEKAIEPAAPSLKGFIFKGCTPKRLARISSTSTAQSRATPSSTRAGRLSNTR